MRERFTYTPATLELLLGPAVWGQADGVPQGTRRDPELEGRRTTPDPRRGLGEVWTMRADVQQAWRHAELTTRQRQALVLRFGLDLTTTDCGRLLGVSASTVSGLVQRGLVGVLSALNPHEGEAELHELHELEQAA